MQGQRIKYNKCQYKILNNEYKIGPMISQGTYGCVYYAEDKLGMPKAIKIIDMECINNQKNSLEKEFRIMKQCEGKFSVECDREKQDNQNNIKFIVMELCSQHSLQDLIFLKGHLEQIEAIVYLKNILCGIINMHHLNFSHRDVKSSNICIRNDRCILIDFGCSREFDGNGSGEMITNVGTIINKSPQILSGKPYTYKTDYWAVGILFYQILTGVTPFNLQKMQTHEEMLNEISNNINFIYDAQYIKKRVEKQYDWNKFYKYRANYKISEKTKNFLSRLITLDPQDRFNERELKNCEYLKEQLEARDIWDIFKCFLPLKNDEWDEIIPKIEQRQSLQKSKIKQQIDIQMQLLDEKKFQFEEITMLRDISSGEQKNQLLKKHQQIRIRDKNKIGVLRKYDFQVKRIKLLIELKKQLKKIVPPLQFLKQVIIGLNYYCLEKMKKILMAASAQNLVIFSKRLNSDVRNNMLNAYLCEEFVQDNKQYSCSCCDNDVAQKCLVEICQRVAKKQQFNMHGDYRNFWNNYKKILQYEYKPSKSNYIWLPWNSFALFLKCIEVNDKLSP